MLLGRAHGGSSVVQVEVPVSRFLPVVVSAIPRAIGQFQSHREYTSHQRHVSEHVRSSVSHTSFGFHGFHLELAMGFNSYRFSSA